MSLGREDLLTKRWRPMSWRMRRRLSRVNFRKKINYAYYMRHNPTPAEARSWQLIRRYIQKREIKRIFFRQILRYGFIIDFYCYTHQLGIEIDGVIHEGKEKEDAKRDAILRKHGIQIIRFSNDTVFNDPEDFLEKVSRVCELFE